MKAAVAKKVRKMWYEKTIHINRNGIHLLINALDIQDGDIVYFLNDIPMTAQYVFPDEEEQVLYVACACDAWPVEMFLSH